MHEWRDESFRRDLSSFPVFGALVSWIREKLPDDLDSFYWEHPAMLGQALWLGLFVIINGALALYGIDTSLYAPSFLFFAFDILNFNFAYEPHLILFLFMAFLFSWMVNKLILIFFPKLRNSSNAMLLVTALGAFLISLMFFGILFSAMIVVLLE